MPRTNHRGFAAVLNNRNFLFPWGDQILSQTAMNGIHFTQIVILAWSLPAVPFSPAETATIPLLVHHQHLLAANSLSSRHPLRLPNEISQITR